MKLREYLAEQGFKHKYFAEKIGVGEGQISKWLTKRRRPRAEMMLKIEKITNGAVKITDWFTE